MVWYRGRMAPPGMPNTMSTPSLIRLSQTICPPVSFISVHLRPVMLNQKINPAPKGREQFPRYHPFSPAGRGALAGRQHALVFDNGRRPRSVLLAPAGGTFFWRLGSYLQGAVPRLLPPYQTRWMGGYPLLLSVLAFGLSKAHSFRDAFTLSQSRARVNRYGGLSSCPCSRY